MNRVFINGKIFEVENVRNVVIDGSKITVDGKEISSLAGIKGKQINITIKGSVEDLRVKYCDTINVKGNAKSVVTTTGNVRINGSVRGDVITTSGDVQCCSSVIGNVKTMSGDVDCDGNVGGNVSTMSGNIKTRKNSIY